MRCLRNGSALFSSLAVVLLPVGCARQAKEGADDPTAVQWHTDRAVVTRVLPILNDVERCAWHEGVAEDRSGGWVPAPSAYFLRGYALISKHNVERLTTNYKWVAGECDLSELNLPQGEMGHVPGGELLESPDLIRSLPSISTYHQGRIVLCPKDGFVYFDLIKD